MKKRILLVEGDSKLLGLLNVALAETGHTLVTAADRWDGLRIIAEQHVDLVVIALVMSEKACVNTILAIRREQAHLPIVALSGGIGYGPSRESLGIARSAGSVCLLEEPFEYGELVNAVNDLLGLNSVGESLLPEQGKAETTSAGAAGRTEATILEFQK